MTWCCMGLLVGPVVTSRGSRCDHRQRLFVSTLLPSHAALLKGVQHEQTEMHTTMYFLSQNIDLHLQASHLQYSSSSASASYPLASSGR